MMDKKVVFNLSSYWLKGLDKQAKKEGISRNELIRILILDYLKQNGAFLLEKTNNSL